MDVPPGITFRNIEPTDDLDGRILESIENFEKVYGHAIGCRVMVHERAVRLLENGDGVGYGFLAAPDGPEPYVHQNAVVRGDFDDLEVGTEVRYAESKGDEGLQPSAVVLIDRRIVGPRGDESIPLQTPRESSERPHR